MQRLGCISKMWLSNFRLFLQGTLALSQKRNEIESTFTQQ